RGTGRPGTTARWPDRSASTTRAISAGGVNARPASCTRTNSAVPTAARPRRTDSVRLGPPATTVAWPPRISLASSVRPAGTATTTASTTPESRSPASVRSSHVRPAKCTNALGRPAPSRSPKPAAGTTATVLPSGRGGQNLVEDGLGLLVVGVLGERELAHQDLARLGQHPLLARREATLLVATPQVAHHLGDLVHVTGSQLLEIGLVATRPVGGLLGMRSAQDLEYLVQALLSDDVADAHLFGIVCGYSNCQVTLRNLQDEIFFLLAFDGPGFDRLYLRSTVVWIDNG